MYELGVGVKTHCVLTLKRVDTDLNALTIRFSRLCVLVAIGDAAAWMLERRWPEEFGRQRLGPQHPGGETKIVIEGGLPEFPR